MRSLPDQVQEIRSELAQLELPALIKLAKTNYKIRVSRAPSKQDIIEEIISEEYRIAGK